MTKNSENHLVKQNINFLEYPLWVVSKHDLKEIRIKNDKGEYALVTGYNPPERLDFIFLMYFIMKSQQKGYVQKLEFTRHEILKDCGLDSSEKKYERLEESLKRWLHTVSEFKGTFYDNKEYLIKAFNTINHYEIDKKTKKLKIELNKNFLDVAKDLIYCKNLKFEEYKKLRRPISARLYEILIKNFLDREEWEIEAFNLATKLTLDSTCKKLYPADIKIKIEPAVNEINKKTELRLEMQVRKNKKKQTIFTFKLLKNIEAEKQKQDSIKTQELINQLKEDYRESKTLKDFIEKYYNKFGYDYVRYNIAYTNLNSSKAYVGFLKNALKNNWGEEWKIKQEYKQKEERKKRELKEIEKKKEEELKQKIEEERQEVNKINNFIENLTHKDKEKFINTVLSYIEGQKDYEFARNFLNPNKKISVGNISMFFNAFNLCYNSYIQLHNSANSAGDCGHNVVPLKGRSKNDK